MNKFSLRLWLILAGLVLWAPAQAADPHALLAAFTQNLQSLSGQFQQRVLDPDGRVSEDSQGTIALAVPRQFRWEYTTPFPQLIVADGSKVWIFDPDLEQVQVRAQGVEEQQSPLMALIDPAELDRQFAVSDGGDADGLTWIELRPRTDDAAFSQARLGFAEGALVRMDMLDTLAQHTQIRFSHWQRNPALAADTFRFVPPPGVDVIGEIDEAAQAFPLDD